MLSEIKLEKTRGKSAAAAAAAAAAATVLVCVYTALADKTTQHKTNKQICSTLPPQTLAFFREIVGHREETNLLSEGLQSRRTSRRGRDSSSNRNFQTDYAEMSSEHLASLNKRLRAAQIQLSVCESSWKYLGEHCALMEAYVDGTVPEPVRAGVVPTAGFLERVKNGSIVHNLNLLIYKMDIHLKQRFYKLVAGCLVVMSALIVWSEVFMGISANLSPIGVLLKSLHDNKGGTEEEKSKLIELVALIPLAYMSVCVYGSLFKLRIFGRYGLRKGLSDGGALVFNAEVRKVKIKAKSPKPSDKQPLLCTHFTMLT